MPRFFDQLLGDSAPGNYVSRFFLVLTAVLQIWALLLVFDAWHYNNDPLNDIASGLRIDHDHEGIVAFQEKAIANCEENYRHPRRSAIYCVHYQNVLRANLYFNYPLTAVFSGLLTTEAAAQDLLSSAARALTWSTFTGIVIAAAVAVSLLWNAPVPARLTYAALFGFCLFAARFFRSNRETADLPTLYDPPSLFAAGAFLAMVVLVVLSVLLFYRGRDRFAGFFEAASPSSWWIIISLVLGAFLLLRVFGIGGAEAQIAALMVGTLVLISVSANRNIEPLVLATVLLVLFFGVSWGFAITPQHPRMRTDLLILAVLAICAARPDSRLVYVLPLTAAFHVSAAALFALTIVVIEIIIAVFNRRISRLFWAALATAVFGILYNQLTPGGELVRFEHEIFTSNTDVILSGKFLYGTAIAVLFALIAGALVVTAPAGSDRATLARAALFLSAAAFLTGFSGAVRELGPDNVFKPGWYAVTLLSAYTRSGLSIAAVVMVTAFMLTARADARADFVSGNVGGGAMDGRAGRGGGRFLILCVVIFFVAASAPARTATAYISNARTALTQLIDGELPKRWETAFREISDTPNLYVVSHSHPLNDPRMYFSLLKLRVQIVTGRFPGVENMRLESVGPLKAD